MATFGQGINPQLGAIDYSPILRGSLAGAQMAAQGSQMIGQGIASLGEEAGKAVQKYYYNKDTKEMLGGVTKRIAGILDKDPYIANKLGLRKDTKTNTWDEKGIAIAVTTLGGGDVRKGVQMTSGLLSDRAAQQVQNSAFLGATAPGVIMPGYEPAMYSALGGDNPMGFAQYMQTRDLNAANIAEKNSQAKLNLAGRGPVKKVDPATFTITDPVTGQRVARTIDQYTDNIMGEANIPALPPQFGNLTPGTVAVHNPATNQWSVEKIQDDPAEIAKTQGKKKFTNVLGGMVGNYLALDQSGGMVNPNNSISQNIAARISATDIGQALTGAAGQQAQSIRSRINNAKPLLINLIRQATGMSGKAMDSNTELQFYLQAASDPKLDLFSNLVALDTLDTQYGDGDVLDRMLAGNPELLNAVRGGKISNPLPKPTTETPTWTPEKQSRLDELKAKTK